MYKYINFSGIYIRGIIDNDQNTPKYKNDKIMCSY